MMRRAPLVLLAVVAVACKTRERVRAHAVHVLSDATPDEREEVPLLIDQHARIVAAGGYHTCALTTAGAVLCWGANQAGQLGDGTTLAHGTPRVVKGLTGVVVAISAGSAHTCALLAGGGVQCWGANWAGQLGDGSTTARLEPVPVSGLSGVTAIAVGALHSCALTGAGAVLCWGSNVWSALGDGTATDRPVPVPVTHLSRGATAITAGAGHSCAVVAKGDVWCWGWNLTGQLGDGTHTSWSTPVAVRGLSGDAVEVAASAGFTCARLDGGRVECWGRNYPYGQLGDGTERDRTIPMGVHGLSSPVTAITAKGHTCVLNSSKTLQCWGLNGSGQLGDGTTWDRHMAVAVPGLGGVASVSAGAYHTCAATGDGVVRCWGYNSEGQLGDGTQDNRSKPTVVAGFAATKT